MNNVLAGFKLQACRLCLDEMVALSDTLHGNLQHLTTVLNATTKADLHVKAEKCRLEYQVFKFLGYSVSAPGIHSEL